ncbi:hypothetical protein [Planococcus dechangensis]|uniref:Uncharacterized protein n=1 Tax=Planococcus dechangensis TaxID=1176255 RepID=A0ABV9MB29_9BACL
MNLQQKQQIAQDTANGIYEAYPNLWERFGDRGFEHTVKDNHHHLDHLETAWELKDQQVFLDYAVWLETVLVSRNVETALIIDNFERLMAVVPHHTEMAQADFMQGCLRKAVQLLELPIERRD